MDKSIKLLSAAVALALLAPSASYATNGYFMIGAGAKTRGMGGAGIAYGQDSLAAAANPATAIDVGSRVDIGAEIFRPIRAVKHNSSFLPADEQSQRNLFLIPSFGISWQKNENMVYNFVMMGAGLGTNYDQTEKTYPSRELATCPANYFYSVSCGATKEVGVDMIQVHMLPGMAYKVNDTHSIGVNLDFAVNRFRARGLQSFGDLGYTGDTEYLTNNGFDYNYGAGIRFGWQGKFNDEKVKLGAYYASKVFMTRFKKYKSLFAEQGKFDVPPHFGVGISVKATKKINVAFDIQYIQYSDVPSIANPGPNVDDPANFFVDCPPGTDSTPCLTGGAKGMGFGWKDQTVFKLGFDYAASNKMTWRFGFNYGKSPIPDDQALFNMLAPAVVEEHFTFGATYDWTKQSELSFNFMHAFKKNYQGYSPFYPDGITNREDMQTGNVALSMKQTALGFSYGYKF